MIGFLPRLVLAQPQVWSGRCVGSAGLTPSFLGHPGVNASDVPTIQGLECLFANVLSVITAFAGLAGLVMFIVGGFQYLSSQGDPKALASANQTLTNAILGLVGVIVSALILRLIATFTGVNSILEFKIGT